MRSIFVSGNLKSESSAGPVGEHMDGGCTDILPPKRSILDVGEFFFLLNAAVIDEEQALR